MPTAFQLLREWWAGVPEALELSYFNPLRLRVGQSVRLDLLDHRERYYRVGSLEEYCRHVDPGDGRPRRHVFVDYQLAAEDAAEPPRLRVSREEGERRCRVLLLELFDRPGPEAGLYGLCQGRGKAFTVTFPEGHPRASRTEAYPRLDARHGRYYAALVRVLKDRDADGRVVPEEVETLEIKYWDFGAEVALPSGRTEFEFVFVERKDRSGEHTVYLGREVDPANVHVL